MVNSYVIAIPGHEVEFKPIRARGPGGQNVNKVSSAVQLRFDIRASSLPEDCKQRLLALSDQRINRSGIIVIKADRKRSQERNRTDAMARLHQLVQRSAERPEARRATRPSAGARAKRMNSKTQRGRTKQLRARVRADE